MSERPRVLEELGEELERLAALTLTGAGAGAPRERDRARGARLSGRGSVAGLRGLSRVGRGSRLGLLATCLALLVLAAAATAAVLLIRQGSPLPAPHAQDLRSSGIPLSGSEHLAGLDAPDPDSANPVWDLRLSRTRGGETCTAVGQVLRGRFGIVGLDHVFRALPLGSVDSCGIDAADGPILLGAHDFIGSKPGEERTVLSGVAGSGASSVTAYGTNAAPRHLKLGPQGSFITVYAGASEEVRPQIVVVLRGGHTRRVALEQSEDFEVPDPSGAAGWIASAAADVEPKAFADEDCVQVRRAPSQVEPGELTLAQTPEVCGRMAANSLIAQMRRFVPGERSASFPWGNSPARTIVYGIASPRVKRLTLDGAGRSRAVPIDAHGGAFAAVLDGHVDPRSLKLVASLSGGGSSTFSGPHGLLAYESNQPIAATTVPGYRAPAPAKSTEPPPFELQIASTVRESLRAEDPAGGPTWVLRSWQGRPNHKVAGAGDERYFCAELGVLVGGQLVEPGGPSGREHPLTVEEGRCNPGSALKRMRYMLALESFLDDPYEYAPHPARTVISGLLPPGATDPTLVGLGPSRPLQVDANNAFLIVLAGRFWNSSPRITYLLNGRRVGKLASEGQAKLFPLGSSPQVPQVRAPDPDGGAPWGFAATADCSAAIGRIVDGRFASIDLRDGVLKSGAEQTSGSARCSTRRRGHTPAWLLREPVEFNVQQAQAAVPVFGREAEPFSRPEIELRTLPGRTIITGVANSDVASVTLSTPSDVRTLRPSGPMHAILAVYDGFFLRGKLTAVVRMHDGQVQTEQIQGASIERDEPFSLSMQLQEAKRLLTEAHRQEREPKPPKGMGADVKQLEGRIAAIARRAGFQRVHPGLLPPE